MFKIKYKPALNELTTFLLRSTLSSVRSKTSMHHYCTDHSNASKFHLIIFFNNLVSWRHGTSREIPFLVKMILWIRILWIFINCFHVVILRLLQCITRSYFNSDHLFYIHSGRNSSLPDLNVSDAGEIHPAGNSRFPNNWWGSRKLVLLSFLWMLVACSMLAHVFIIWP